MKRSITLGFMFILLVSGCAPVTAIPTRAPLQPTQSGTDILSPTNTPEAKPTPSLTASAIPTVAFTSSPAAECKVAPILPDTDAMAENNIPEITEEDWAYGTTSPKLTILSYCSFQKPACRTLTLALADLQHKYQNEIRIVSRIYPQPDLDDKSLLAMQAAEAAGMQRRFWEMNNLLYTKQSDWLQMTPDEFMVWLKEKASFIGLSRTRFESDMTGELVQTKINNTIEGVAPLALTDTPVLFYNGILVKSGVNVESLEVLIKYFLLPDKGFNECPEMTIDPEKEYTATFKTEKGVIVFELFPDKAPWAVNSFVFLAKNGWYNNSTFFRVIPGFVAQGGDPSGSGLGSPGYNFSNEVNPSLRFDKPGVLAMTNKGIDTNGSQFFITYTRLPELDGQYTIFGQVVEGMDILSSLRPRNPDTDQILLPADTLISVTIKEQ